MFIQTLWNAGSRIDPAPPERELRTSHVHHEIPVVYRINRATEKHDDNPTPPTPSRCHMKDIRWLPPVWVTIAIWIFAFHSQPPCL